MFDEDPYNNYEPEPEELGYEYDPHKDPKLSLAKKALKEFLLQNKNEVFYSRQLEVKFERDFYHWITNTAIRELFETESFLKCESATLSIPEENPIKFYFHKSFRYPNRKIKKSLKLINEYSQNDISIALGDRAERLFSAEFHKYGFEWHGRSVNEFRGKKWQTTNHDLDYIISRDGIHYGCEIKNSLDYISLDELKTKLEICKFLEIVPFFILRWAPKSYIEMVRKEWDGFTLLFEWQLYPPYFKDLVGRIKNTLGLKVDCPRELYDSTFKRFVNWHEKLVNSKKNHKGPYNST